MGDDAAPSIAPTRRGRVVRWMLPAAGSVALMVGGFWAVEFSRRDHPSPSPALNPESAALYAAMVIAYAVAALGVRRWRQPDLPAFERRSRAALEAFLVAFAGAPAVTFVLILRAFYVGDLGG